MGVLDDAGYNWINTSGNLTNWPQPGIGNSLSAGGGGAASTSTGAGTRVLIHSVTVTASATGNLCRLEDAAGATILEIDAPWDGSAATTRHVVLDIISENGLAIDNDGVGPNSTVTYAIL